MLRRPARIFHPARFTSVTEQLTGLPAKYAVPSALGATALLVAGVGMYWDIGWHVDFGRDKNLFTGPHTAILLGIGGIVLAGFLSLLIPGPRAAGALRVGRYWLPPGGFLVLACSAASLIALPLDSTWHQLFGEDLTLWSPTHLLLIGGASLSILGMLVLSQQGVAQGRPTRLARIGQAYSAGLLLVALSALQAEFDFGVPQFQLLYQPIMIALAAAIGLVVARRLLGPLGAIKALAVYYILRGSLALLIGVGLDHTVPHFPLYLGEALVIEFAALRRWRDPLAFGVVAGVGVGSIGLASEWGWSHLWMPYPWTTSLLPEAAILGLIAGVAGGVIGARIAVALQGDHPQPVRRGARSSAIVVAALAATVVVLAVPLGRTGSTDRATVVPFDTRPGSTQLRVKLDPPDAAEGAEWFRISSFQGGFTKHVELRETAPGSYVTEEPVPTGADRDIVLRMARGPALVEFPVSLAGDEPGERRAPLERRSQRFERENPLPPVTGGKAKLQKAGYLFVAAIAALWLILIARSLALMEGARFLPRPRRTPLRRLRPPRALQP